jgi:hypothetical protein
MPNLKRFLETKEGTKIVGVNSQMIVLDICEYFMEI